MHSSQIAFAPHAYLRSARAPLSEFWNPRSGHGRPRLSAPDPEQPRRRAQPPRSRSRSLLPDLSSFVLKLIINCNSRPNFRMVVPGRSRKM
eukprot:6182560-Pleurochrysis_carterae.AAC.1